MARRYPSKPAIAGTRWEPTFGELDAAGNLIAAGVVERAGDSPGRVALAMAHDAPLIATLLGVLKAGKAVVALNPGDPPARRENVLAEVEPQLLLEEPVSSAAAAPPVAVAPHDLAALIYTSGSTGRPQGVMQTHRNVLHNVLRHTNALGLSAEDRVVLLGAVSGGQGLGTVWTTLLNGATLCPFPIMERGMAGLADWIEEQAVTVFVSSASVFRHFARTLNGRRLPDVRLVRLGSEPAYGADFDAFRRHFDPDCLFANTFSSSETGSISHCLLEGHDGDPGGPLPVGRPAQGTEVVLVGGEIVVRSDHLSPGYWRNQALTARRFPGDGGFHTGDLGVVSDDGVLTVVGRRDTQVKVRGQRVDPTEVEAALAAHPGVAAAGVAQDGEGRLTAYVTANGATEAGSLREWLRKRLPGTAVPTAFELVDALPLNAHGKLDREALGRIGPARTAAASAAPLTATEERVASIWATALGLTGMGRDDDFFDLGGDSLTAAAIAAEIHSGFGVEVGLRAFAESPTVAAMAELVDRSAADDRPPLAPVPRLGPLPCSFSQEHVWRSSRTPEQSAAWNVAAALSLRGPLDVEALRAAIARIVDRHEILRTTFVELDGAPHQLVHDELAFDLPLIDLSSEPDPASGADELLREHAGAPFDLENGPLLRLLLVRLGEDEHRLLRINHHIIGDGASWPVLFRELATLYEGGTLEDMGLQYADFAAWERSCLDPAGERYRAEIEWWGEILRDDPGPMPLPFTRPQPDPSAVPADGVIWWSLDLDVTTELERAGAKAGATFYMVGAAALSAQLAFETGRDDIVLGTYASNRRRPELQAMFGFFSNLTTLRLRFPPELSFRDWLAVVRRTVLEMSAHTDIPHQMLCEELHRAGIPTPEARAIYAVSVPRPRLDFGGLEIEQPRHAFATMPHGFTFSLGRESRQERCVALFDAHLHDPAQVQAFIDRFRRLTAAGARDPDRPLNALPMERGTASLSAGV